MKVLDAITQGKWRVRRGHSETEEHNPTVVSGKVIIGRVGPLAWPKFKGPTDESLDAMVEAYANARLISAAPELYKACEGAYAMIENEWGEERAAFLLDAMNKAEGRKDDIL